jgi:hypothetical protein
LVRTQHLAAATADALRDAGLVTQGAAALRIEPLPDGEYRARLATVSAAAEVAGLDAEELSDPGPPLVGQGFAVDPGGSYSGTARPLWRIDAIVGEVGRR